MFSAGRIRGGDTAGTSLYLTCYADCAADREYDGLCVGGGGGDTLTIRTNIQHERGTSAVCGGGETPPPPSTWLLVVVVVVTVVAGRGSALRPSRRPPRWFHSPGPVSARSSEQEHV